MRLLFANAKLFSLTSEILISSSIFNYFSVVLNYFLYLKYFELFKIIFNLIFLPLIKLCVCIALLKKLCYCSCGSLHKKWSFPLRISSVNVTKFAGNCGFGHICRRNLNGKLYFSYSFLLLSLIMFSSSPIFLFHLIVLSQLWSAPT